MRAFSLCAVALLVLAQAPSASAEPLCKQRDRTDNSFSFTYDASDGSMPQQTSGTILTANDKVTFHVIVRAVEGAEIGERLQGNLTLELLVDRAIEYDGTFKLKIQTNDGTTVLSDETDAHVVLRPKKGQKRARLEFRFDLPSGDYIATARFASGSD